jgi:glyoxylase-like metal-dependent hydrolase (beta-lactamase superfamily II)
MGGPVNRKRAVIHRVHRFFSLLVFALCGLSAASGLALAQAPAETPEISFESIPVADGIVMIRGVGGFAGGNMALLLGQQQVAMIDDGLEALAPELLAHALETAGRPVDFLINTHVHGDHVGGNAQFAEQGTVIFAHENIRHRLVVDPSTAGGEAGLPVITFAEGVNLHLDGLEARVTHLPRAHTDGDALVHFPARNVIHAGDLVFHGLFPFIDLDNGGTVDGYLAAQEHILSMADAQTRIIPGHGELTNRDGVARDLAMLQDGRARVAELVARGFNEQQVLAAEPLAPYAADFDWAFIDSQRMTRTLYRDLSARSD